MLTLAQASVSQNRHLQQRPTPKVRFQQHTAKLEATKQLSGSTGVASSSSKESLGLKGLS